MTKKEFEALKIGDVLKDKDNVYGLVIFRTEKRVTLFRYDYIEKMLDYVDDFSIMEMDHFAMEKVRFPNKEGTAAIKIIEDFSNDLAYALTVCRGRTR